MTRFNMIHRNNHTGPEELHASACCWDSGSKQYAYVCTHLLQLRMLCVRGGTFAQAGRALRLSARTALQQANIPFYNNSPSK